MNKKNHWRGEGMVKCIKNAKIFDKTKEVEYDVTDITLSIKESIRGKDKFTTILIEAWGSMSQLCSNLREGDFIAVEGPIRNKTWKNGENKDRKLDVIVVETINRI